MKTSTFQRVFSVIAGATLTLIFQGQLASAQTLKGETEKQLNSIGSAIASTKSEMTPVAEELSTTPSPLASFQSDWTTADGLLSPSVQTETLLSQVTGQPTPVAPATNTQDSLLLPDAGATGTTPAGLTPGAAVPIDTTPGSSFPANDSITPGSTSQDLVPDQTTQVPGPSETTPSTDQPLAPTDPNAPGTAPVTPVEPAPAPAQVSPAIQPGRATRSGPSYIGIGGNIGLGEGDTALGEGSFAIFSKIGLTRNLSVRPTLLFSDNPTILIPVTFDFIPGVTRVTEDLSGRVGLRVSPFIGPGIAISTGDDGGVDFLVSGGVDIPITRQLTATASVNASFFDNVAVGLLLGIGINF